MSPHDDQANHLNNLLLSLSKIIVENSHLPTLILKNELITYCGFFIYFKRLLASLLIMDLT